MRFIKQLQENDNIARSFEKTYYKVKFLSGFAGFLEALKTEGLIPEKVSRTNTDNGVIWNDTLADGGLKIITSEHPLPNNYTSSLSVIAKPNIVERFEAVLRRYARYVEDPMVEAVEPEDVQVSAQYHEKLNPVFWEETDGTYTLRKDRQKKLLEIATEYFEFLKMPKMEIQDITITGSNANYNWTPHSDIDLHILVDKKQARDVYGILTDEYIDAKRKVWNEMRDIRIKDHQVELYVQDLAEPHFATGLYSLKNDEWLVKPKYQPPNIEDMPVKEKVADFMNQIDEVVEGGCNRESVINTLVDRLKTMRQSGLERAGEFSVENLTFKELRRNGYIEKLFDCRNEAIDKRLSAEEEEWWKDKQ